MAKDRDDNQAAHQPITAADLGRLNARLEALERENAKLRSDLNAKGAGDAAVLKSEATIAAERQREETAKRRRELKHKAKKSGGMAHYIVGPQGAYRNKRLYAAGEHILIPAEEDPSITWTPADSTKLPLDSRRDDAGRLTSGEKLPDDDKGLTTTPHPAPGTVTGAPISGV